MSQSKITSKLREVLKGLPLEKLQSLLTSYEKKSNSAKLMPFNREILRLRTPLHIQTWGTLVEKYKNLLVEASRDHGKSLFFSFAYPIFKAIQSVNEGKGEFHICLISYAEKQAQKNLRRIRMEIETNPNLACLRPPSKSHTWDTSELICNNGVTFTALGF